MNQTEENDEEDEYDSVEWGTPHLEDVISLAHYTGLVLIKEHSGNLIRFDEILRIKGSVPKNEAKLFHPWGLSLDECCIKNEICVISCLLNKDKTCAYTFGYCGYFPILFDSSGRVKKICLRHSKTMKYEKYKISKNDLNKVELLIDNEVYKFSSNSAIFEGTEIIDFEDFKTEASKQES